MIRQLRMILPPDWAIITFVLLFLLMEGPIYYYERQFGRPIDVVHPGITLARFAAFFYGMFRVRTFHPALRPEYRSWLERTPWTSRKPLPAGPVALVWGDVLALGGIAAAVAGRGLPEVMAALSLALFGYLTLLASTLFATETRVWGFMVAFGVGLAIRLWPDRPACLAISIACYIAGWVGLRSSLAKFPWPNLPVVAPTQAAGSALILSCGWPFDQLCPKRPNVRRTEVDRVILSLLSGWYFWAAESVLADFGLPFGMLRTIFVQLLLMMVVSRIALYIQGYSAPIGLAGRIRSFRWIIPGYDQVFIAPLCTALIGLLALDRFRPPGLAEELALPIAISAALLVTLTAGPDLERWQLTGNHRLTPSSVKKSGQELVKVG